MSQLSQSALTTSRWARTPLPMSRKISSSNFGVLPTQPNIPHGDSLLSSQQSQSSFMSRHTPLTETYASCVQQSQIAERTGKKLNSVHLLDSSSGTFSGQSAGSQNNTPSVFLDLQHKENAAAARNQIRLLEIIAERQQKDNETFIEAIKDINSTTSVGLVALLERLICQQENANGILANISSQVQALTRATDIMTAKRTFVVDSVPKCTERVEPVKKRFSLCSGGRGKRRKMDSALKTAAPFHDEHGNFHEEPSDSNPRKYHLHSPIDGKRTYQTRNVWDCNLESQALQFELLKSATLMNKRSDDVTDSRMNALVHMEDDDDGRHIREDDEKSVVVLRKDAHADDEWSDEDGSPDQF